MVCLHFFKILSIYAVDVLCFFTFQVSYIWKIKYGILLVRSVTPSSETGTELPIVYSLLHPLDEITPLLESKL